MKKGLSRRDFLKGAAASAAGIAAVGILGACSGSDSGTTAAETSAAETTAAGTTAAETTAAETSAAETSAAAGGEGGPGGPGGGPGGPGGPGGQSGPVSRDDAMAAAKAEGRVFGYSGPGDWLGEAPSQDEFDEEVDCDVVVVGCGHSGVQASLAAAEEGAKVITLERMDEDVFGWYGEDIGAWNSQFAKDAGFGEWNLGEVVNEFITRGGGRCYPDIVRSYVQNSGATLDHMLEVAKEMQVDPKAYTYDNTPEGWVIIQANHDYDKIMAGENIYDCMNKTNYPLKPGTKTWASCVQFMGEYNDEPIMGVAANSVLPIIEQACIDKAKELGAEFRYGNEAVVLVQNEDGDVVGVIGRDEDGKLIKYNTSMGVCMCGGDYAGNAEMCWALLNEYMERNEREGGLKENFFSFMGGRGGESVKIMCWAGGMIEPAPRGSMLLGGGLGGPWGTNAMLWLNSECKRFCNEGNLTGAQTACARQAQGSAYLVTDKKWMKSVCASGVEHSGPNGGRPQYYQDMLDGMEAIVPGPDGGQVKNCTIAERGYSTVIKADTLEELAGYMGIEEDKIPTFIESINHYNEMCAAGMDTDYGKDASAMIPVDEAPFFGVKGSVGSRSASPMMVTMSGVMTDATQNVLKVDYTPIKGLYTAGNSLGGRYGTGYSTPCAGNSIGMAVTHGRLAGKNVVAAAKA